MPYIIETRRGCGYCTHCGYGNEPSANCLHKTSTRTAVATLDEAREAVRAIMLSGDKYTDASYAAVKFMPEAGDTFSPLPDGTVIEVRRVGWTQVGREAGLVFSGPNPSCDEFLAAFNAA